MDFQRVRVYYVQTHTQFCFFFYFAILKMVALTYSFYLSLHSLYCFDPQSKQRKLKQKLVFTKKIWCVCIRPLLFSCTHMHKKVLLIKIDQTYWHKISTTAVHLCTSFDPYYLLVYFLSVVDHIKVEIVFLYFRDFLKGLGGFEVQFWYGRS